MVRKVGTVAGRKHNLVGREFGRLTVVRDTGTLSPRKEVLWVCRCGCGNPDDVVVPTSLLLRGFKKSCNCLRGRRVGADHLNRDCREAVLLALYWAARWGEELCVHYGHDRGRYVIHRRTGGECGYQIGYVVTPGGVVTHRPGYPDYPTLFGRKSERIHLQFRRRGASPPEPWTTYRTDYVFFAHQRGLAEEAVRKLDAEHPTREHRIKED